MFEIDDLDMSKSWNNSTQCARHRRLSAEDQQQPIGMTTDDTSDGMQSPLSVEVR